MGDDTKVIDIDNRSSAAVALMVMAGALLLKGDRPGWAVLYRASKELEVL